MNTSNFTPARSRKPRSKFALLPPEDQKRVIELCDQHTYHEALEIIAKPRPEGLQLESSYGALVRFYTAHNQQARAAYLLNQTARTVQLTRQAHPGALRGAILTMVESRIYDALRRQVPISELSSEFVILKDFHKGFLSEEKWRTEKDSRADTEWSRHLSVSSDSEKDDFIPIDENGNPTEPEPISEDDLTAVSELDPRSDEAALAKLDYTIATRGRDAAHRTAAIYGFDIRFVEDRIAAYTEQLRQRGISAVQAAMEARAAASEKMDANRSLPRSQQRKVAMREGLQKFIAVRNQPAASVQDPQPDSSTDAVNPDKSTSIQSQLPANPPLST